MYQDTRKGSFRVCSPRVVQNSLKKVELKWNPLNSSGFVSEDRGGRTLNSVGNVKLLDKFLQLEDAVFPSF